MPYEIGSYHRAHGLLYLLIPKMIKDLFQVHPEQFPKVTGKPHYIADQTTCVLPVLLNANTTYAIWINTGQFNHFRDKQRLPAIPYLLVFRTTNLQR